VEGNISRVISKSIWTRDGRGCQCEVAGGEKEERSERIGIHSIIAAGEKGRIKRGYIGCLEKKKVRPFKNQKVWEV